MQVLMYRASFDAVADALATRPDVTPVIMNHDTTLTTATGEPFENPAPEAAWLSRELMVVAGAPIAPFVKTVLSTPGVRWVQSAAAGYEHPTFQKILAAGMRLTINDASSIAISEYVLAEVMAAFQPLTERRASQAAKRWDRHEFRELNGSRWLILGYGSIGRHVAERAAGFGAEVVGIRRTPRPDTHALRVVAPDALRTEIAEADVFVICAAANDDNAHLVNAEVLAAMRPGSVLVNIARGSIVDSQALRAALDAGRPALAVLDVFETEPLPEDDPLWTHPQVRVTAHCSSDSDGTIRRGHQVFLEHLDAWRAGSPMRLEVLP
ncbi:MAG TPA: D-2-hydroxyacid dehydrogenase [Pseudomonadales bacterium]|nr:D-2-hydroxyacid dehydrogenase [Pseudomonadales bacterium]